MPFIHHHRPEVPSTNQWAMDWLKARLHRVLSCSLPTIKRLAKVNAIDTGTRSEVKMWS